MEFWENRVNNGIIKAHDGLVTPETITANLSQDIVIYADPSRTNQNDLWPGIWVLASTLSRQFSGKIYIVAGLRDSLPAPSSLSPRCIFTASPPRYKLVVSLGCLPEKTEGFAWFGDAKGSVISMGQLIPQDEPAHPCSAFAIAAYLSYALLATAVGISPHKERFSKKILNLDFKTGKKEFVLPEQLTFLGLGHLGNAYLALLYFLGVRAARFPRLVLLDRGRLEPANLDTHVLLTDDMDWHGMYKVEYFSKVFRDFGVTVETEVSELIWGWKKRPSHPPIAVLGLDSFDARQMAVSAGYDWLVEAGLGSNFNQPRISWHSLPGDRQLGKQIFNENVNLNKEIPINSPFAKRLEKANSPCGLLKIFQEIDAATPSMGILAAVFVWMEILKTCSNSSSPMSGSAYVWSPIISPTIISLENKINVL